MKSLKCLLISAGLMWLAGCQAIVTSEFCATNDAVRPAAADFAAMSDIEIERIARHNRRGELECGWRA